MSNYLRKFDFCGSINVSRVLCKGRGVCVPVEHLSKYKNEKEERKVFKWTTLLTKNKLNFRGRKIVRLTHVTFFVKEERKDETTPIQF